MKHLLFKKDPESERILIKLKEQFGMSYTESVRRSLFLLDQKLSNRGGALELGKALVKKNNDKTSKRK